MGNETEADGMPSYLQPDTETDYDNELNLPAAPTGRNGASQGRVQVSFNLMKCFRYDYLLMDGY